MTVGKRLSSELQTLCKDAGVDFTKTSQELSEFIGDDEVLEYCILHGPFPTFPDTMFEVAMLGKKCLYDFEMTQRGALRHILPLGQIIEISEEFGEEEAKDSLSVHVRVSALGTGLLFQSKLEYISNIRKFTSAVIRRIVGST